MKLFQLLAINEWHFPGYKKEVVQRHDFRMSYPNTATYREALAILLGLSPTAFKVITITNLFFNIK